MSHLTFTGGRGELRRPAAGCTLAVGGNLAESEEDNYLAEDDNLDEAD